MPNFTIHPHLYSMLNPSHSSFSNYEGISVFHTNTMPYPLTIWRANKERRQYEVCCYYSSLEGKIYDRYSLLSIQTTTKTQTLFFTLIFVCNIIPRPTGFFFSFYW